MKPTLRVIQVVFAVVVLAGAGLAAVVLRDSAEMEVIASFTTDLGPRSPEQRHNILRAAARVDGVMVKPGEEFSFNRRVGLCGVEQGYERAPAIIAGEMRDTWGGGVCQVSSTLYNAALLANLKITERHPHSRRASSVPPGRDATTAFGVADLRFVNTTGAPIRIVARETAGRLSVKIMGDERARADVEVFTEPGGLARVGGARGVQSGQLTVSTYRVVRGSGGESSRELVSNDTYLGAASGPAVTR